MKKGGWDTTIAAVSAVAFFWLLLFALMVQGIPQEKMANTVVRVAPSKSIVAPGETFTIDVKVEPVAGVNVAGWQFDLAFNKAAFRVDSVVEGALLKPTYTTFFLAGTIDNSLGKVTAVQSAISQVGGGSVTAAGVAATLHCTALAAGQLSAIVLSNVVVGNKDGVALPLDLNASSQVQVAFSWDLNLDGLANVADMTMLQAVFGSTGALGWRREDVNADGVINVLDVIIVGQHWTG